MREVNSINMKNEEEANIFVAKVMRVAICVFTLVFVLNIVGIFVVKTVPMTVAYISGVVLLIIPTILVNILKLNKPCLKYIFVTLAVLTVSVFTVTINWHVVIFYSFAIGVATLYFSKGLSIYATVISVVFYSGAQIIAYNCNFTIDKNVSSMNDMLLYCVLPRAMALITLSALFLALATRTRKMLDTLLDADKQFKIMKQMEEMKEKSINVSDSLVHNIEILSEITVNTKQNNEQVAKISETATQASENTLEQLNNVTGNIENISNNLSELVDKTSQISKLSLDVQQFSINNLDNMKHISQEFNNITDGTQYSKEIINELRDKSQEIGQITQTITDISSQTNLLALNASIEAARAGEAGKGFAVVAEEIRNLAEQTNNSVADISSIIESFVDNTMKAVVSMDKNTTIISEGINIIKKTDDMSNDMVRCTDEMNSKINSVSNLIKQVSQFSNEIVDIIKDVQSISTESRDDLQKVSSGQASAGEEIKKLENIVESINEITKELQEVIK